MSTEFHRLALGVKTRLKEPTAPEMLETVMIDRTGDLVKECYYHPLNSFDIAHCIMLVEQGIVPRAAGAKILGLLLEMHQIPPKQFVIDPNVGDILISRESYIIERLGEDVGGRLHTGRSRGDVFHGVLPRMAERAKLLEVMGGVVALAGALLERAEQHVETVMPGYSHLQHAQPTTLAHYLVSFAYPALRDVDRLEQAYARTNQSPAGAGILTGSGYPIDRARTAQLLGFDGVINNTRDAVWSEDHTIEALSLGSLIALNVARLASDLDVWSSFEFRMIELADRHCGTSSIMPQKKNPYALEYLRGLAAIASGMLQTFLSLLKVESDEVDNTVFQPRAYDTLGQVARAARLMAEVVRHMAVKTDRMAELAGAYFAQATDLADAIGVEKGLAFRTAHRIVGTLVRLAVERGLAPDQMTPALVDEAAQAVLGRPLGFSAESLGRALDPQQIVQRRTITGGPAPVRVREQIAECRQRLDQAAATLDQLNRRIQEAEAVMLRTAREMSTA